MKRFIFFLVLFIATVDAKAQTAEVTQLVLNIEKLNELRKILKELKAGYEILFKGYNTIKQLSEGNFKLHQAFLDGLLEVSPAVKNYSRVKDIIACQLAILSEYQSAYRQFSSNALFSEKELEYIKKVHADLAVSSIKNLDALADVLTAKKMRASDDERLKAIDNIYESVSDQLSFLRQFNGNAAVLASQRAGESSDAALSKRLYDLKP